MAKIGFNGQWIDVCRVGKAVDSKGTARSLDRAFLEAVIANYAAGGHEAPLVVGHPESDTAPAFGWVKDLRLNGDILEAQFAETDDEFEQLVAAGRYKKRSASFYLDTPNLRHIGFLGAQPPAIKGLRDIQFAEGESFAVESITNFKETVMEEKDLDQMPESFWEKVKSKLGISPTADLSEKPAASTAASFSEAEARSLVDEAVKAVKAEFAETVTKLEDANKNLQSQIDGQVAGGVKSEIASFVEAIPAEKGKHFLKRIGIAEFMESLAAADAADGETKAISFSEGEGDKKVDHEFTRLGWFKQLVGNLPNVVEFGEKFGNIVATKEADAMVNIDRVNAMKEAAGVAEEGK
jgi:hypothetical protein